MKTAFIFPGLNSLLNLEARKRYLDTPDVLARLSQAERALKRELGFDIHFQPLLMGEANELYAIKNISLAAVAVCAVQVGAYESLMSRGHREPDWVMGCSLGDIARAVISGSYDFETAVVSHVKFTRGIDGVDQLGGNIGVMALRDFTPEDFEWFDQKAVDVSRLTSKFLNIGGLSSALAEVSVRAREKRWRVMPILNYPAHSRYLIPYVQAVAEQFETIKTTRPRIPIFSSLSCKPLEDPSEIRSEFLMSITRPIHWHQAVEKLIAEHGVTKFINIGPCTSLSKLMPGISTAVEMRDAWEI